jgi:cell division GTPase FtsZ
VPEEETAAFDDRAPQHIVLAGIGREGAERVHELDALPEAVRRLYLSGSPKRAYCRAPGLVRLGPDGSWRKTVAGLLEESEVFVAVAAVTGREEANTMPEALRLARQAGALCVAVLFQPLLSRSDCKTERASALTQDVRQIADATMVFPAGPNAGQALTAQEAMESWRNRLSAAIQGLLAAAAAENAMEVDFVDIKNVLSGHCRATAGAGKGKTVQDALRNAAKNTLAPPAEVATARCVFAHVIGDNDMPLDDARRVQPVLQELFPGAECGCGVAVSSDLSEIRATIIAGRLDADVTAPARRTLPTESPFFKVGDPALYDGVPLDVPTFARLNIELPGRPPRPVPMQPTLF